MLKYLAPLGVFIGGNFLLLIGLLFFPALKSTTDTLATGTAGIASTFWGWTWVVGSTRLIIFVIFELLILFATAKSFLKVK